MHAEYLVKPTFLELIPLIHRKFLAFEIQKLFLPA